MAPKVFSRLTRRSGDAKTTHRRAHHAGSRHDLKRRDIRDYLQDILEAITDIENFVADVTYEEFVKDRKTLNAVVRSIKIIGEHPKNFPNPSKQNTPSFPGKKSQACETNSSMHTSAITTKPSGNNQT